MSAVVVEAVDLWWHPTVEVLDAKRSWAITRGDCLTYMQRLPDASVDLIVGSPPYEDRRWYGELQLKKKGQDWVDWMVELFREMVRVCKGLVAMVVGHGTTRKYKWSAVPSLLEADLHRAGFCLRNPPAFCRVGISGSGGPDFLRADHERIVCATHKQGKLPWSNNIALGHPPKWGPGGEFSYRIPNGQKRNQWGGSATGIGTRRANGKIQGKFRPSHRVGSPKGQNGLPREQNYHPPVLCNPGNLLKYKVGGGLMGHPLAHKNEAPYPLGLAEMFVLSFCPPGGIVYDPFSGSGTTVHAAVENKRRALATDARGDQCQISVQRISGVTPRLLVESDERKAAGYIEIEEDEADEEAGQEAGLWSGVEGGMQGM